MFSGVSLSDRLKAAVNQLEATGSSLQQRALTAAQQAQTPPLDRKPSNPPLDRKASNPATAAKADDRPQSPRSPPPTGSASHLADSAVSGLNELRRSFSSFRNSQEGSRPSSADIEAAGRAQKRSSSPLKKTEAERAEENKKEPEEESKPDECATKADAKDSKDKPELLAPQFDLGTPNTSTAVSGQATPAPAEASETAKTSPPKSPAPEKNEEAEPAPDTEVKEAEAKADAASDAPEVKVDSESKAAQSTPAAEPAPFGGGKKKKNKKGKKGGNAGAEKAEDPKPAEDAKTAVEPSVESAVKDETPASVEPTEPEKVKKDAAEEKPAAKVEDEVPAPIRLPTPTEDDPAKTLADTERRFEGRTCDSYAANKVLKELTPVDGGIADSDALEGWVRMVTGKVDMITTELTRLQDKMKQSRMQEMRETHKLESKSQSELVDQLRSQLSSAESTLSKGADDAVTVGQLRADLAKAQTTIKEEEEKRSKAISLLKTVRQKLVKIEKEKEEIEKDRAAERAERSKANEELEKSKAAREREVNQLRKGFERELASAKERAEKDLAAKKAAWELEMITTKEITAKNAKITGLETIVKEMHAKNAEQFGTIESRQADAESARAEMELAQTRTKELEFELREANERIALLEDASRHEAAPVVAREETAPGTSAAEVQRLLAEAEARSETKLSDLRAKIRSLERERNELEEDWAQKLGQRVRELEAVRRTLAERDADAATAAAARKERDAQIDAQDAAKRDLERQIVELRAAVDEARADVAVALEAERAAREELETAQSGTGALQQQLDESRQQVTQLRATNKTIRDEMRKIQSSVQLMERQRNPGVGYWAQGSNAPTPTSAASDKQTSGTASPTPSGDSNKDEEVNLEYLRNVILQFLEHREMRPNLVRVLSVILRFTPQELRRLEAKLNS
ncbi:vesicle-mediated transport-related protein [Trichosporon asahii var. asahii CBS 2479]|uniref:Vesicle-mediated transport-related protein n=1 Tax=Trichosporon asahii var. asahii (strain ATCC 90039 / CBS 2479 / JCM 2466 / KCTC 7840 / NBRC 103889/ NCYC 2677 / UAMH 7654) TaxID=1186058 RepID=J5T7U7_TRIAS|nr:vesicle-mediated transport-related protein [Trichosporon asahii var. asahii CBS 2479]EJT49636.1 vesicle-mediated transport-related protein [Trichosporon asahii var. asahii CBS 2479]